MSDSGADEPAKAEQPTQSDQAERPEPPAVDGQDELLPSDHEDKPDYTIPDDAADYGELDGMEDAIGGLRDSGTFPGSDQSPRAVPDATEDDGGGHMQGLTPGDQQPKPEQPASEPSEPGDEVTQPDHGSDGLVAPPTPAVDQETEPSRGR